MYCAVGSGDGVGKFAPGASYFRALFVDHVTITKAGNRVCGGQLKGKTAKSVQVFFLQVFFSEMLTKTSFLTGKLYRDIQLTGLNAISVDYLMITVQIPG